MLFYALSGRKQDKATIPGASLSAFSMILLFLTT